VCLLRHFTDVVVPAERFMDIQSEVLGGLDVVQYLCEDSILGLLWGSPCDLSNFALRN
jgi:hypothetical protein